ncbi:hypothetical protein [Microbacterium sp. BF1]|jgi:hypothetical protein|uniref:hypothetical protein n=1 Tax=Microbacterium sp. BF1 TaxID=2821146 RepID=UPI001C4DD9A4|nr:hypothetical protein [Microbacterium sp. BF1]
MLETHLFERPILNQTLTGEDVAAVDLRLPRLVGDSDVLTLGDKRLRQFTEVMRDAGEPGAPHLNKTATSAEPSFIPDDLRRPVEARASDRRMQAARDAAVRLFRFSYQVQISTVDDPGGGDLKWPRK